MSDEKKVETLHQQLRALDAQIYLAVQKAKRTRDGALTVRRLVMRRADIARELQGYGVDAPPLDEALRELDA